MSNVLPKEKQTAYERWEMASFGESPSLAKANEQASQAMQAAIQMQVAQQVEALRAQAQQEGQRAGHAAGYEAGHAAGLAAGRAAAAAQAEVLHALAQSFNTALAAANETVADDLLSLALDLAKAMLKTSLAVRPELMLPLVGDAIRYLPTVQQPAIIYLNPQDVALVREHMADELAKSGWRIAEDMHLDRGGCRVETASNQIDAGMQTRWQRIAEALGKSSDWLA